METNRQKIIILQAGGYYGFDEANVIKRLLSGKA